MTKTFENYPDLTADLAFNLIERLGLGEDAFGFSNQSCSAYVNVTARDEEDEYLGEFKVRFSDHADRHGSDITIRIDDLVETVEEDGEYVEIRITDEQYQTALARAAAAVAAFQASL